VEKKLNLKKVFIVSIISLLMIGMIVILVWRNIKSDVENNIVPSIPIEEADDGMVKYENNIQGIIVKDRKVEKMGGKQYIIIEIENNTGEDKFDLPIGIEFVNLDGDVIYNTGHVIDVLLKGMTDRIQAVVTPQIAELVKEDKIDHIIINELK